MSSARWEFPRRRVHEGSACRYSSRSPRPGSAAGVAGRTTRERHLGVRSNPTSNGPPPCRSPPTRSRGRPRSAAQRRSRTGQGLGSAVARPRRGWAGTHRLPGRRRSGSRCLHFVVHVRFRGVRAPRTHTLPGTDGRRLYANGRHKTPMCVFNDAIDAWRPVLTHTWPLGSRPNLASAHS